MIHPVPTLGALERHPITKPLTLGVYGSVGVGIAHAMAAAIMAIAHQQVWRVYAVAWLVPVAAAIFLWRLARRVFATLHRRGRCTHCATVPEAPPIATIKGYRE